MPRIIVIGLVSKTKIDITNDNFNANYVLLTKSQEQFQPLINRLNMINKVRRVLRISETYICTLPHELRNCDYRDNHGKCLKNEKGCGFREKEKTVENEIYKREKRWYEEYATKEQRIKNNRRNK